MDKLKFILILCISGCRMEGKTEASGLEKTVRDAAVLMSCDFNNCTEPYCQLTQDSADDSDWTRHRGPTPTPGTGPSGGYPDGDGYYIYHESDNVANGKKARLLSPALSSAATQVCVQFRYYMYGADSQSNLRVLVKRPGSEEEVWKKFGIQSPLWLGGDITVSKPTGEAIRIVFEAQRGFSASCDTALDNIVIREGACPLTCPPDAEYTECGPACIPSCKEPSTICTGSCISGCFCKPGYVFKGPRCVPLEKCGCLDDDKNYYEPGEIIFGDGCSKLCRCVGNYTLDCVKNSCDPNEECREVNGVSGCYPKGSQNCVVSGAPHYNTFDGNFYSFMGMCTYTLATACGNHTGPRFSVEGKNEERGLAGVSYLKKLYVTVDGVTVTLMKSRRTLVNGRRVSLPHSPSPLIYLFLVGQYITLQTPFGLRVRWDGNHYAQISVPSSYRDQMCGLCGDYDGQPNNDFTKPDGTPVGNVNDFGNSWRTDEDEDDECTPGTGLDPDCDPALEAEVVKPEKCGKITDPAGPFRRSVIEERLKNVEDKLMELQQKDSTQVVFSAAAGGSGTIGPFSKDITFIYRTVITNIGNAYSNKTGIFTAPVDGVYYFTYFYHAGGNLQVVLLLYKNNERVASTSDHASSDGADNGGNGVTLRLIKGDQVYVHMRQGTHVWGDSFGHTTFSGFLLHQV